MAGTKNRRPTVKTVLSWIQAGYGQGEGGGFKPFMYVRDVPSEGTSSMVRSRVTRRTHHYLSSGEFSLHLLAEYSPSIVDIREQYALLPWNETQEIAAKLGVKHPIIPSTKTPSVLTTDLLLSFKEPDGMRLVAVSFKPEKKLTPRAMEKLLLERVYWNRRGITWLLVTDKTIPSVRAGNLRFFEDSIRNDDALRSGSRALAPCHGLLSELRSNTFGAFVQELPKLNSEAKWMTRTTQKPPAPPASPLSSADCR